MKKLNVLKKSVLAGTFALVLTGCGNSEVPKSYYTYLNENPSVNVTETDYVSKSYADKNYAERTEALGLLEGYAVDNNLTGITLFEDGSYVLYNDRLNFAANEYIVGYGWGTFTEGSIKSPLASETKDAWKMYYHSYQASDPSSLNYMDDKGSVVGDLNSYVTSGYWTTQMNDEKDGYKWVNELALDKPIGVNADDNGLTDTYKFRVSNDFKYNTLSTNSKFSVFNNRTVELEDYITPYKELYNQSNGLARGADGLGSSSSIKGLDDYYAATRTGYTDEAWESVGLKASEDTNGDFWLEVTFEVPLNSFYAMYYLASGMMTPIPADFVDACGGMANVGKYNGTSISPVDTFLSTGQFTPEYWEVDKTIVFKANPNFIGKANDTTNTLYTIEGVHYNILASALEDSTAGYKEFTAGKIDSSGIPSTMLSEPIPTFAIKKQTNGGTTTKLNVNSTTQEEWEALFGENGSVAQTAKSDYWAVEPAMSNQNFLNGLNYAIDRVEYATSRGSFPSNDYFGSMYLSDPEAGLMYNDTDAHAQAMANLNAGEGTEYGYNLTLATANFQAAINALIADGSYKTGDTITLDIVWQSQSNIEYYSDDLAVYFAAAWPTNAALNLEVVNIVPAVWSDAYYKHMMVGQFDLGFGSISGNSLNPLNFLEVLKSDNSSGFTLNWGTDTSIVDESLFYDGQYWSFDALWQAFDTAATVVEGKFEDTNVTTNTGININFFDATLLSSTPNADGSRTVTFLYDTRSDTTDFDLYNVCIYVNGGYQDLEFELTTDEDGNKIIVVTMPKEYADGSSSTLPLYLEYSLDTKDGVTIDTYRGYSIKLYN